MPDVDVVPGMEVTWGGKVGVVLKISGAGLLAIGFVNGGGFAVHSCRHARFTHTLTPTELIDAFKAGSRDFDRELRGL